MIHSAERLQQLLDRGVVIPHPQSVLVDASIIAANIAPNVVLYPGCRLIGSSTSVGPGCRLGGEAPLHLQDSHLGHGVELKGGFVDGSVFLDGANMGSSAHIRPGCLIEEQAGGAHAVGLKQTILLPFVTLGSLINFCDILMAGGTSRNDHSEVGSSFIHFNFTPHGDKATASLIGDIPRGVLMDQPPIFLGGQGGLVGPVHAEYGSVLAAGSVARRDLSGEGHLVVPGVLPATDVAYDMSRLGGIRTRVQHNLRFIANLFAMECWYRSFRSVFMRGDEYRHQAYLGGLRLLEGARKERIKRLEGLASLAGESHQTHEHCVGFASAWPETKLALDVCDAYLPDDDVCQLATDAATKVEGYLEAVQNLDARGKTLVTSVLQKRVDSTLACAIEF